MAEDRQQIIERFRRAVLYVRTHDSLLDISNERKLLYYSHYKQATMGDVKGNVPNWLDYKGSTKYAAWAELKGSSPTQSMRQYIALLSQDCPNWL